MTKVEGDIGDKWERKSENGCGSDNRVTAQERERDRVSSDGSDRA